MKKFICLLMIMSLAGFVMAHWDEADGHKMHWPQLPDPNGWDVNATFPKVLADDWRCSLTGWIWDIHFWGSWKNDYEGTITSFYLSIHKDIPAGTGGIDYSRPGDLVWEHEFFPAEFEVIWYGEGTQGWYDPNTQEYIYPDHFNYYQYNIFLPIELRIPQEFDNIYWLDVSASVAETDRYWGWKTSMSQHFMDNAVWGDFPDPFWEPLYDPLQPTESLDLAFVINGDETLPVELSAFTGEYLYNVPTLYWVTQSETDNLGWYVYRSTENSFATAD
ncbi:MAG: hypothetical protein U9R23_06545, partial [Candidatus Cloacimonadota bacterium]|nr:hypothetical protein [Candidatus Cloacimonadota bacterium]